MAILPINMPARGGAQQYFEPETANFLSPEGGGRLGAVQAGNPKWAAEWSLGRIGAQVSDEWRGWVARVRQTSRPFLAGDRARPYPLHYPHGFSLMTLPDGATPFDGALGEWSQMVDSQGDAWLTLQAMPSGFILSTGDYVGFRWDDTSAAPGNFARRALVRCDAGGMADAAGELTVRVVPPLPVAGDGLLGVVPTTAIAHLDRPMCVMKLIPEQRMLGPIDRRLAVTSGTIKAVQELRP